MVMNWEAIKERGREVYAWTAQLLIFLQLVSYLAACVVAEKPIGLKQYVSFAYHCVVEWAPVHTDPTPVTDIKER
jgi:hypothetical protein